ncbi:hypothetical protein vBVpP1_53 [Vibrio phage vB_VpP_1]|nr:hypothetical protein vBVpP1_53 [Vibrio phage vB_VpP_1]
MSIEHNIKFSVYEGQFNKDGLERLATLLIEQKGRLTELSHKPVSADIRDVSLTIKTGSDDPYKPGDMCYLVTGKKLLFIAYHPHHPCAVVEGGEGIFTTPFDNLYTADEYKKIRCLATANDAAELLFGVSLDECRPDVKATIISMVEAGFEQKTTGAPN